MAQVMIDGKTYQVDSGKNLLHVCLSLGLNLPYFCWHPALGSVGACRQCAVKKFKDAADEQGKLVMACMEPVDDGARIAINDPEAREMRANVIEWLMTNHPHDCPVCDEGGHCHLQDMTVMTGHSYRRFRFNKRTYRNQYLGPFIHHEMNRCIQCYRCVRFYRDYAGGRDLNAFAAHNHVYFGRHEDGVLENEFSGNLVEVCPTGVFTDKTARHHYARKWDLQSAPSICHHCGLGCNVLPGERYGKLVRIDSRYNGKVNGYFLCDRGRFGYEFVNGDQRIRRPLLCTQPGGEPQIVDADRLLQHISPLIANRREVLGIGSPRASLEANYALRTLVGSERFYSGMSEQEHRLMTAAVAILKSSPARTPSLKETEQADAVLVLGEDLTNTAPMLALALRQAVRNNPSRQAEKLHIPLWHDAAVRELLQDRKGPLFIAAPDHTRLDDIAAETWNAAPDDLARLGFAVAHELDDRAPAVKDLPDRAAVLAKNIARALRGAENPLVVSGTACGSEALLQAAANIARALCTEKRRAGLCFTVAECNSMGQILISEHSLRQAMEAVEKQNINTVIVLENDLYRRADKQRVDHFLDTVKHLIVVDCLQTATTEHAEAIVPAAAFAESHGTLVNNEGRAQRFYQTYVPESPIQESWRWLQAMMVAAGLSQDPPWQNLNDLTADLGKTFPVFQAINEITPPPGFRVAGQKIPRQPHRYSGRTAMNAHINVHEPKPPEDSDSPLSFSMEGYRGEPPSPVIPFFWSPGWNSVQAINKYQIEVGGPLHGGDPGRRLLEPQSESGEAPYFQGVPEAFLPREEEWWLVPLYHIFGSEELSIHAPAIAERAPKPYLALNPADGGRLNIQENEEVILSVAGNRCRLPVRFHPRLPQGLAGLPAGMPGLPAVTLPAWSKISGVAP